MPSLSSKRGVLRKRLWPKYLAPYRKLVAGVHVGGCVNEEEGGYIGGGSSAHACPDCPNWICFRTRRDLTRNNALHEVAHLLTMGEEFHHGAAFYEKLTELHGGRLPRHEATMKPKHEKEALSFPALKKALLAAAQGKP